MRRINLSALFIAGMVFLIPLTAKAMPIDTISSLAEMNVCGPRVGMMGILDNGPFYQELIKHKGGRAVSQFGWHFEYKFVPIGGGPSFLLEMVPLIGGVEYGMFIPSISMPVGIRLPFGTEFGMGPCFSIGTSEKLLSSSIIFAAGHSFDYKGVGIPINLFFSKGPNGNSLGLLVGYAITRSVRKDVQQIEN
jgi:hypothetical protein